MKIVREELDDKYLGTEYGILIALDAERRALVELCKLVELYKVSVELPEHGEPDDVPCDYVAGCNQPGYLPVGEPQFFETFDEAKRYVIWLLVQAEDDAACMDDEALAESIAADMQDINLESEPFSHVADDGLAYWVEKVNQ